MHVRHRPKVAMSYEETDEGWAAIYRVACPCGDAFPSHFTRKDALAVRDNHYALVAPPAEERCRDPRAHRNRWWDACPLCAGQASLPGFEHLTPATPLEDAR